MRTAARSKPRYSHGVMDDSGADSEGCGLDAIAAVLALLIFIAAMFAVAVQLLR